jgi:hypothetical protein
MVLVFNYQPVSFSVLVNCILVRSKEMYELLSSPAKQKKQGEPAGKGNMDYAF